MTFLQAECDHRDGQLREEKWTHVERFWFRLLSFCWSLFYCSGRLFSLFSDCSKGCNEKGFCCVVSSVDMFHCYERAFAVMKRSCTKPNDPVPEPFTDLRHDTYISQTLSVLPIILFQVKLQPGLLDAQAWLLGFLILPHMLASPFSQWGTPGYTTSLHGHHQDQAEAKPIIKPSTHPSCYNKLSPNHIKHESRRNTTINNRTANEYSAMVNDDE